MAGNHLPGPARPVEANIEKSGVTLGLYSEEVRIGAILLEQVVVGATFSDVTVFQDIDAVGHAHGRKAVADQPTAAIA